jgi:hypothetical protein
MDVFETLPQIDRCPVFPQNKCVYTHAARACELLKAAALDCVCDERATLLFGQFL